MCFKQLNVSNTCKLPTCTSSMFLFWFLCRVSPLPMKLWFHAPDVTDRDGVRLQRGCLFLLYLFLSNSLSSWGLSRVSNIRRCCSAMIVSRQQRNCGNTRQLACNSQSEATSSLLITIIRKKKKKDKGSLWLTVVACWQVGTETFSFWYRKPFCRLTQSLHSLRYSKINNIPVRRTLVLIFSVSITNTCEMVTPEFIYAIK